MKRPQPNGLTSYLGDLELSFLTDYLPLLGGLLSYLHSNPVKIEVSGIRGRLGKKSTLEARVRKVHPLYLRTETTLNHHVSGFRKIGHPADKK